MSHVQGPSPEGPAALDRYNIVDERDLEDGARKLGDYAQGRSQSEPAKKHDETIAESLKWI